MGPKCGDCGDDRVVAGGLCAVCVDLRHQTENSFVDDVRRYAANTHLDLPAMMVLIAKAIDAGHRNVSYLEQNTGGLSEVSNESRQNEVAQSVESRHERVHEINGSSLEVLAPPCPQCGTIMVMHSLDSHPPIQSWRCMNGCGDGQRSLKENGPKAESAPDTLKSIAETYPCPRCGASMFAGVQATHKGDYPVWGCRQCHTTLERVANNRTDGDG